MKVQASLIAVEEALLLFSHKKSCGAFMFADAIDICYYGGSAATYNLSGYAPPTPTPPNSQ